MNTRPHFKEFYEISVVSEKKKNFCIHYSEKIGG